MQRFRVTRITYEDGVIEAESIEDAKTLFKYSVAPTGWQLIRQDFYAGGSRIKTDTHCEEVDRFPLEEEL